AVRSGLGPKTMRKSRRENRQPGALENLVPQRAAQRDLRSRDQAEVSPLNGINLSFGTAGIEADPLQHFVEGQVGGAVQREAFGHQLLQRALYERHFQEHRLVLEKIEPMAGDART